MFKPRSTDLVEEVIKEPVRGEDHHVALLHAAREELPVLWPVPAGSIHSNGTVA
jgi:hypothetical protein